MIRQLEAVENTNEFLGGYLRGYAAAYGTDRSFLRFYGDEKGGQLAIMDGVATLCWHEEAEELFHFLLAQPEIHTVRACPALANEFSRLWGGSVCVRPIMKCEVFVEHFGETTAASPRELYPFLADIFPEMPLFEEWYVDVSYRVRHGFSQISAILREGAPVACAMTVTEWEDGAVIGAVATHPDHRRKGYAALCVSDLTASLQAMGKTVYICPKNDNARRLYERLGFSVCGETAIIERN